MDRVNLALKLAVFFAAASSIALSAQTVTVDLTRPVNHFIPKETLGAGVDRIPVAAIDQDLQQPNLEGALASGWQAVTYRQNTELAVEAWHWNPKGTWSDPAGKGYFVGSDTPTETIRYSYGYKLPRRGFTRNDGTDNVGFSRITDGDLNTFWKSNPYLSQKFTGESDALHPQWIVLDLAQPQRVNAIRIAWGGPYAKRYAVQYWTGEDPIRAPTHGVWQTFPRGEVTTGKAETETVRLSEESQNVRFVRLWMTDSSNTCTSDGPGDPRNCVGYAIREIYLGTLTKDGDFHDILRHTPDQEQTTTYCSSVDPWHEPSDLGSNLQAQVGFDLFFTSGVTRGQPAMIPVALIYETPENAAAEIAYLRKRNYPISYIEMGEEADGQYMLPEDYAALYLQWATAIHRIDPTLKLGGPSFQGVNRDVEVWPDANGKVSWLGRFLDYLKQHGRMQDLAFFSFEHYPYEPCHIPWGMLYDEPELVSHIMEIWREDGLPADVPMFITESNLSSGASETFQDIFSGIWLADYIGSFLASGGKGIYFFHYLPLQMEPGCNSSPGTFGMFTLDANYQIQQSLPQFFVSQLINLEWVQPNGGEHALFPVDSDIEDGAGHQLVTAYATKRPDGNWAVMLVNRDQQNKHFVHIAFDGKSDEASGFTGTVEISRFGSPQYQWHPASTRFMAHAEAGAERTITAYTKGWADPDGPIVHEKQSVKKDTLYEVPAASVMVVRGQIRSH
ncbi:MAG TPA: discoidin domain-containing protein [Candidatus Sulfotelmatobacter sp.]|nr:discoidin domain-containing protein [Candidatus Sulfotelmatobacter sp.]